MRVSNFLRSLVLVAATVVATAACKAQQGDPCEESGDYSDCGDGLQCCGYIRGENLVVVRRGICVPDSEACDVPPPEPMRSDSGVDAGTDGDTDAGTDTGTDSGVDAGT